MDQWAILNKQLSVFKVIAIGYSIIAIILLGLLFFEAIDTPIIAFEKEGDRIYLKGQRVQLETTDRDIDSFAKSWAKLRYTWGDFKPNEIISRIRPFTTEGLIRKLRKVFERSDKAKKEWKGKKVSKYVGQIEVTLTDKEVQVLFDKVIRINEIPIIVPTAISLVLVQGTRTEVNPHGLFINGVIHH